MQAYDVVIIGAGHNGLVCAAYLLKAGYRLKVWVEWCLERRIVNNNESILKIDCALSETPRFEHHNHKDEYLMGSVLIADSVDHVEVAHNDCVVAKIPDDDPSMFLAVPSMRDPLLSNQRHNLS